ncbi:MAG: hypothetical protein HQL10_12810 [Nitrospirae bacterium]|nr:hypothetical protein [Nitrospirota bacterium]
MFIDGLPAWKKAGSLIASTGANLKGVIDKDIPHVLIDVRPADYAKKEHIKGAVNIPLKELAGMKPKFPENKKAPIVIYCASQQAMEEAFKAVRGWGYVNASYLAGGMEGWKKAGNPVENDKLKTEIVYVPKPRPGEIMPEEFKTIAASTPSGKFILDVRDADEAAEGMIKGAKNIPTQDVGDRIAEIPKDKEIIIHCSTGARAEIAYNTLKEKGFKARFLNATVKIAKDGKLEITKED